jgi:hypothetical protein
MRRLIWVITTIIILAIINFAQNSSCPLLSVTGPSGLTKPGEPSIFTATLSKEAKNYKIEYVWTVSGGKIVSGQRTNSLTAIQNQDELGKTLIAAVTIKGLPKGCQNEASASGEISDPPRISARKVGETTNSPLIVRKETLALIAAELKNDPTATLVIEEWINQDIAAELIKQKLSGTFSYLTKNSGISREKISWQVFNGFKGKRSQTVYWIVPAGAASPENNAPNRKIKGSNFYQDLEKYFPKAKKKSLPKRAKD